jgi:hypothetical protein
VWASGQHATEAGLVRARVEVEGSASEIQVYLGRRLARYFQGPPLRLLARRFWRLRWLAPDMGDQRWSDMFWGREPEVEPAGRRLLEA